MAKKRIENKNNTNKRDRIRHTVLVPCTRTRRMTYSRTERNCHLSAIRHVPRPTVSRVCATSTVYTNICIRVDPTWIQWEPHASIHLPRITRKANSTCWLAMELQSTGPVVEWEELHADLWLYRIACVRRTAVMVDATEIAFCPDTRWNEYSTGVYIKQRAMMSGSSSTFSRCVICTQAVDYVATEWGWSSRNSFCTRYIESLLRVWRGDVAVVLVVEAANILFAANIESVWLVVLFCSIGDWCEKCGPRYIWKFMRYYMNDKHFEQAKYNCARK